MSDLPRWYSENKAAKFLKIHRTVLRHWRISGWLAEGVVLPERPERDDGGTRAVAYDAARIDATYQDGLVSLLNDSAPGYLAGRR